MELSKQQHWTPVRPPNTLCHLFAHSREFNRYWWFGGDPSVFIHVEEKGGGMWGQYKSQKEADALRDSQHPRGKRGAVLRRNLCQVRALFLGATMVYWSIHNVWERPASYNAVMVQP